MKVETLKLRVSERKTMELTMEQAKELYDELKAVVGEKVVICPGRICCKPPDIQPEPQA